MMKQLTLLVESGFLLTDDASVRLKKVALTLVPLIVGVAAFIWGTIYFVLGHPLSGSIPMSYSIISAFSLAYFFKTKKTGFLQFSQLLLVLILPFMLMWSLGGFAASSMVMIWAIFAPIAALMFLQKRGALGWFLAFAALVLLSVLIDDFVKAAVVPLSQLTIHIFFLLNLGCGSAGLYLLVSFFIKETKNAITGFEQAQVEILSAKNNLEQRVSERTKELQDSEAHLLLAFEELRLAANVFTHAREAITITDANANIVKVNDAFCHLTGYSRDEVVGRNPSFLKSGRQDPEFYTSMWNDLNKLGSWTGEIWNRHKNGEAYAQMLTISAVYDDQGRTQHYVALCTDITPLKVHQEQLERMANYDALTGLPNRVLLSDRLSQAAANAKRHDRLLAVCFLDLDGFKPINDQYGHETGDQFLVEISKRLMQPLRAGDTVSRLGGDEFVLLITDVVEYSELEITLKRILDFVSKPLQIGDFSLQVSASVGVTICPLDDSDPDTLLRHADQAMYQAKQLGRNRFHLFDMEADSDIKKRHQQSERIRQALQDGEFRLYYQPKVDMRTGKVIGMEALIRWQHPERGIVGPLEFLPLVEQTPLIIDIGEWVLREALAQIGRWAMNDLQMAISVNIAAHHFQHNDFVPRLRQILSEYPDVSPELLEIEILESAALDDIAMVCAVMGAFQPMGVKFSLDDFGTGYSSLSYLKRLPANTLKIDQSFIRDMLDDREDLAITEGIIGLAKVFEMGVIAEGVETADHGLLLMRLGCDLAQGYGIGRPMPASEVRGWLENFRPDPKWVLWGDKQWDRLDQPLLLAQYEHIKWVQRVIDALKQVDITPSAEELADHHYCRFGSWYEGDGNRNYGHLPQFVDIETIHVQVHHVGTELIRLRDAGDLEAAHALCQILVSLKEQLLDKLLNLQHAIHNYSSIDP